MKHICQNSHSHHLILHSSFAAFLLNFLPDSQPVFPLFRNLPLIPFFNYTDSSSILSPLSSLWTVQWQTTLATSLWLQPQVPSVIPCNTMQIFPLKYLETSYYCNFTTSILHNPLVSFTKIKCISLFKEFSFPHFHNSALSCFLPFLPISTPFKVTEKLLIPTSSSLRAPEWQHLHFPSVWEFHPYTQLLMRQVSNRAD